MIIARVRNYGKKFAIVTFKADLNDTVLNKKEMEDLRESLLDLLESVNREIINLTHD